MVNNRCEPDKKTASLHGNRSITRLMASFRRSRAGVAASEFALLLPMLVVILFGSLQYGVMFMTYNSMVNGARSGARAASLGDISQADIIAEVKSWLPAWVPSNAATVTITNVGADEVMVNVSLPSTNATVVRLGPMPDTLTASVLMARES